MFILGIAFIFDQVMENKTFLYWSLFVLSVLWYSATVADSVSLSNATLACQDSWHDTNGYDCNGDTYGVTIAVDVLISLMLLVFWVLFCNVWKNGGSEAQSSSSSPSSASAPVASTSWFPGGNAQASTTPNPVFRPSDV